MYTLFTNGAILTQDAAHPRAKSVLLCGDRIAAVFDEPRPDLVLPGGHQTVDLGGRCLLPGFNDAHIHFIEWGFALGEIDLHPTRSPEQIAARVAEAAASRPAGEVIVGAGWSHNLWPDPTLPSTTALLDKAAPNNPVVLHSKCLHLAWINAAAMQRAGIDAATRPPAGGEIDRLPDGRPTGILKEYATGLLDPILPVRGDATRRAALERATAEAHRQGITAIHSVETLDDFACFQTAECDGALGVRVYFFVPGRELDHLRALRVESLPMEGRLTVGGIKLFADGSLGGRTAFMDAPYEGEPDNRGIPIHEPEALREIIVRAAEARLACATHGIGDAAIGMILDAVAAARERERALHPDAAPLRHRIEHFQTPRPADIARCAHLGVAVSMQPVHLFADWSAADRFLGDRAAMTYALRSIRRAGIAWAFGSDAPVETVEVAKSLHAAVNRQDLDRRPEGGWRRNEAATLAEALEAHTLGGARMAGDAARRGRIVPGAVADLVLLDRDPTAMPPEQLLDLRIEATIIDGSCVYSTGETISSA